MSTTLRIVGLALAIGLAGFGCSSDWGDKGGEWSKQGSKSKKKSTPVAVVELETVSTGSVRETLNANAVIDSESMADIIPMTSGIVVSLHQDEGDAVRKLSLIHI